MIGGWRRWRKPATDIALIAAFLAALSYLPPDTSLADRETQGVLRFCFPDPASGLIRADQPDGPGPELALMQAIARDLNLSLHLQPVPNMGRSFNPRDWQVGRGQCDILGGGLADSDANRGFLTLLPNGGRIGLVRIGAQTPPPSGTEVGVFMGSAGLDRVRLSTFLRAAGWRPRPLANSAELAAWIAAGHETIASNLAELPENLVLHDLPEAAGETKHLAFGMWRGDVTLTRAVRSALQKEMKRDQSVANTN